MATPYVTWCNNMENSFVSYYLSAAQIKTVCLQASILEAIADGRLEARAALAITSNMLYGNPDMLRDTTEILLARGLKKNRRQKHGQTTLERYW